MKIRLLALTLSLLCLAFLLVGSLTAEEVTGTQEAKRILSKTVDVFPSELGFLNGEGTGHGNNQTRLLNHPTGIYITTPLEPVEDSTDGENYVGLWRLNPDNSIDILFKDILKGVPAGATTNVMADKNGDVWVAGSWDEGYGFYALRAWKYSVSEDKVYSFKDTGYFRFGGMYGKPNHIIDVNNNCIYYLTLGGTSYTRGDILWFIFDLETGTWSENYYVKTPNGRADYHFAYADGKGGFYSICEDCYTVQARPSNIEGLKIQDAISQFHSRKINAAYTWESACIVYVPNAREAKAYKVDLIESTFDVENGLYANNYNVNNDLWLDPATGYLYSIVALDDDGKIGYRTILSVYDTNQMNENIEKDGPFKLLTRKDLLFVYGYNSTYSQKFYKDTEGNIYLVAVSAARGNVEIWKAQNNPATEFRLVYNEDFEGYLNLSTGCQCYAIISATERNNSIVGDVAPFILMPASTNHWTYFSVDFAALREYLAE